MSALMDPPLRGDPISIPLPLWGAGVRGLLSTLTFQIVLRRVSATALAMNDRGYR